MRTQALSGLRVLEYGHMVAAAYATKLLADLGADVCKVEPPGSGDSSRHRGPFAGGAPHPERSGLFLYLNANKRGVTLDLEQQRGRELFADLAKHVDLVVHCGTPAEMERQGFEYERLAAENAGLVMTSITPFGLSGPHRDYAATDLTLWNAGGVAYLNGGGPDSGDLPPLQPFGHQAEYQGALNAAVASLGALFARLRSGRGQHIVVSMQESVAAILELTFQYWPYMGVVASRLGQKPIQPLDFLECRDGWVFVCCVEEHQWHSFVELMGNPEWAAMELFENRLTRAQNWDALKLFLQEWASQQSVQEVYHAAQKRRIPFAPVSTMADLLRSEHLASRSFFATVAVPGGERGVDVPGCPYRLSASPWAIYRPPPQLGEHNEEILGGLPGIDSITLRTLRQQGIV
jgi:crotonobetainyl-CoA:carnitine CoA-transferase CaiB-like acyl-CoA transferase